MRDWPVSTNQPDQLHTIFSRLLPQDVEDFYSTYQYWLLQQRMQWVQAQIVTTRRQISENRREMETVAPSATAHAVLARLHVHGVHDIDLLDRLLEHNDTWLNHTIQLLEQCELLGFIQDNYSEWCEYALEGAYDWITSMNMSNYDNQLEHIMSPSPTAITETITDTATKERELLPQATEEELLQKLMSEEDDETVKRPSIKPLPVQTAHKGHNANIEALDTASPGTQASEAASPIEAHEQQKVATTRPLTTSTPSLPIQEEKDTEEPMKQARPQGDEVTFLSAQSASVTDVPPQRGPTWRLFNVLARFFFAT